MKQPPFSYRAKVDTRWLLVLFVIVWTCGCLLMASFLTYGLITTPDRIISELIGVVGVLIIAAFLTTNYILWQLAGSELLILSENKIEFHNKGILSISALTVDFNELEQITTDNDKRTPYWIKLWGVGGGKLVIHYLGRKHRFGQDLSKKQADRLMSKLIEEIERRKKTTHNK